MTKPSLRVLVLGDFRSFHLIRYISELRGQGCEVITASLEDGEVVAHQLQRRGLLTMFHYPLSSFEIRGLVKTVRPDIINPHFASGYGFSAALAKTGDMPPIALHLWGSDILIVPGKSIFHRHKTAFALRAADLVIGDSRYLVEEAGMIAKLGRAEVIPWGIEEEYLRLHRTDYALGNPLRIIVPRPHEPLYNNHFLLRALAPLLREDIVRLTFPAFGSLYEMFRAEGEQLVPNGIKYYDKLSRDKFLRFMAGHDCYLSAAISDSSPVSMIEAMALGLLPVVADIRGVREWLTPEGGWLYEQDNAEELLSVFRKIISLDDNCSQKRQENLARVKNDGLFEQNISRTIALMRKLAPERPECLEHRERLL